jgi:hypothetical protein
VTREAISGCYLALWLATAAGAALASAGVRLVVARAPRDALQPSLDTASGLLAHNALVALWPLALVAIGWPALAGARLVGDALIAAQLLAHGLIVGSALAQHPDMWRYLPHLPLEWLALAIPAAAWLTTRAHPARPAATTVAVAAGACVAALLCAAALETYLVPVP